MKSKFHITGLFYEIQGYKFRKFLNIKRKDSLKQAPDLMVVMMNPGGSKPVDGIDNNTVESEAIPDRTQDQIMKVMTACNLEYGRILNLSDLREAKSGIFYNKLAAIENEGIAHSIFDENRQDDFNRLLVKNVPIIFGWGVGKELKDLAEMAIHRINDNQAVGLKKEGADWAYYHPLPQNYQKQIEWVANIIEMINNLD